MTLPRAQYSPQRGFTLTELAIVLVIVALLVGGMTVAISTQREVMNTNDAQRKLNEAMDALLGFAALNGRLPCPAYVSETDPTVTSGGNEAFCTNDLATPDCGAVISAPAAPPDHGRCAQGFTGYLPARTLGVTPADPEGFALDAWGQRIRYAISAADDGSGNLIFTGKNELKAAWNASPTPTVPDKSRMLRVCSQSAGATGSGGSAACADGKLVADNAVAVLYSRGANGGVAPPAANVDEIENGDNDRLFVARTPDAAYDDVVTWLSPHLLYNRMITAGRLP